MIPQLRSPLERILVSHRTKQNPRQAVSAIPPRLSWTTFCVASLLLFLFLIMSAKPASSAQCSASNMPTGRTLFAVDNPKNQVVVLDASSSPVAVACTIAVGNGPTNLTVSPDSSLLFVENDSDASLTVVALADPSLPGNITTLTSRTLGISAPMAANLATSPDGKFLYLVSIGTGDTQAQLSVISLPTLGVATKVPIVTSTAVPVSRLGPVGVTFTPTTSRSPRGTAYVTTESAGYVIDVATQAITMLTDSANGNSSILAGTAAVDPAGSFAYAVNASSSSGNATVYRIATSNNSTAGLPSVIPLCTFAGSSSITAPNTPTAQRAYYTCAGSNFIQTIDTASNSQTAVGHVGVGSGSAHPQGIAIPFDGVTAYVGLDDGTLVAVDIASSTASPPVSVGTSLRGVATRPPKLSNLSPQNLHVSAGGTASFSAAVTFANSSALIWSVNAIVGGNATVGTIDSTGRYSAPKIISSGGTVTVAVTSPEAPPVSPIPLLSTTVAIDPVLVITTSPQTLTAGVCSGAFIVQSQDGLGNPAPVAGAETLALTTNSSGGAFFSDNTCTTPANTATIPATASTSSSFFYKDTQAGLPMITVTGSATFTPNTVTQTETVNADVAAHFAVSAPATATAGTAFNFTVTAQDQFNNTATGYTGTVHFSSSDGSATLPANSTLTNGTGTFSATLKTAGSQTITATDTVTATITGTSSAITVSAAAATHFVVSAPATATSGIAFTFTVTAQDQFNNTATGYTGTVHFSSSDGSATLPANSTLANGTGTFSATLKTAGNHTITATDTVTSTITGTSGAITVSAATATHFALSAPATATAGTAFTFTVTAQDQNNNTATGYTGTVHFTSSDGSAVLPADSTLTNGTGTFSATLKTAGSQTITATDTVTSTITGTSSAIAVSAAAATHFAVSASATATAGTAFNFTVTAQDQFNNTATGYIGTVGFTSTDNKAVLPANSTLTNGTSTFSATLKTAGNQTINATDTVTSTITGTSSAIAVSAGAAATLVFTTTAQGQTSTSQPIGSGALGGNTTPMPSVFVALLDANGNLANKSSASITVSSSPANVTGTTTVAAVNGVATFSNLQFTIAGTYTLTAVSGSLTTAASNPFTLSSNITVTITSTFTTVKIEDLPSGTDTFMATANGDPNSPSLNVAWAMVSCGGSTTNLSLCGTVTPGGAYTPPQKVPVANGFVVQATANADPTKVTASGTITIGSSVTVSVSIVQGSILPPATNTVAVGFPVSLQAAVGNDPNNLGVMNWSVNGIPGGNSTVGTVVATDSTHATYTAPTVVPSPATINITASSVADFNKVSPPGSLQIVADQLVFDTTNPTANQINIPTSSSSGSVTIDLQGTAGASLSSFACTDLDTLNGKSATCAFASTSGSASACPPTAQCTSVNLTLSVVRGAVVLPAPESYNPWTGFNRIFGFSLLLILALFCFAMFLRPQLSGARIKHAFSFALLLCLSLGWLAACGQFVQPATPTPPVPPITQAVTGNLTVTATIGSNQVTIKVPFTVN